MLFQQFLAVKNEEKQQKEDCFDQLKTMVESLFKKEVPSIQTTGHLLFNANLKIQQYLHAAEFHRKQIDLSTALGTFHQEAYEIARKKGKQLQLLMDSFILLNIEEERERVNHRLMLVDDKIEKLYRQFQNKDEILPELKEKFWQALKEDLIPILVELR
ncbi:hypothetical protein [Ureibacillus thermophilus]|uniref:Uncharacterized protein n=1 Tax=Ureibacillus thermophilus TaxID=367743 RepID=A0A4P6UW70_9BACL|nr:hypothetical protein [Ureibacillus thermophilus]QBK26268.1 hypothetical protein DKZ56_10570 [Ureibacillus thermophilus]